MPYVLSTFNFILWIKSSLLAFFLSAGLLLNIILIFSASFLVYMAVMAVTQIASIVAGIMLSNKYSKKALVFFGIDNFLLRYASADIQAVEVELAAFNQDKSSLKLAADNIQRLVITADPEKLQYASYNIQNDRDVVMSAVMKNGRVLEYASDDLKKDEALVLEATINAPASLTHANEDLQIAIVTESPHKLKHARHRIQRLVVKKDPEQIRNTCKDFQNDENEAPDEGKLYMERAMKAADATSALPEVQERHKIFDAARAKYKDITIRNGSIVLPLTEEESSQDILVAVLSLYYYQKSEEDYLQEIAAEHTEYDQAQLIESVLKAMAEDDKNKLEIILTALYEENLVGNLECMLYTAVRKRAIKTIQRFARKQKTPRPITSLSLLFKALPEENKIDFPIDFPLLRKLDSDPIDGLKNFVKEPLMLLICKSKAPGRGGFDEFRAEFMKDIEKESNYLLKLDIIDELSDEQYAGVKTAKLSSPHELTEEYKIKNITATIKKLDDAEFMDLLMKLTIFSLRKLEGAILNSNKSDREAKLKESMTKMLSPNNLCS